MTHRDVFILGAGFSKAVESQMPTMKELTNAVKKHIAASELDLPLPLTDPENRDEKLDNNIELWMTYLSQRQPLARREFQPVQSGTFHSNPALHKAGH